jgi:Ni,Fe-hydrogenase III component G
MTTESALQSAKELLASWTVEAKTPESNRLDILLEVSNLLKAVKALIEARWGYLAGITGLDLGVDAGVFEILYHFCEGAAIVSLRVSTPRQTASVPTICEIIPSASFYERELREMFGVNVEGLADSQHLFLPDDWTEGVYPLRKDAVLDKKEQENDSR